MPSPRALGSPFIHLQGPSGKPPAFLGVNAERWAPCRAPDGARTPGRVDGKLRDPVSPGCLSQGHGEVSMPCVSQTRNAGSKAKSDRPPTSQVMLILSLRLLGRRPPLLPAPTPCTQRRPLASFRAGLRPGHAAVQFCPPWGRGLLCPHRALGQGLPAGGGLLLLLSLGCRAERSGARRWCRGRRNRDKESQGTQSGAERVYVLSEPREDGRGTGRAGRAGRRAAACPCSTGRGRAAAALSPRSQCSRRQSGPAWELLLA